MFYIFIRGKLGRLESVQSDTGKWTHNNVLLKAVGLVRNDVKGRFKIT